MCPQTFLEKKLLTLLWGSHMERRPRALEMKFKYPAYVTEGGFSIDDHLLTQKDTYHCWRDTLSYLRSRKFQGPACP